MGLSSSLLGLRALQSKRKLHLPTYVATRFLLESVAGHSESSWVEAVISRKYPMREVGCFQKIKKFKKINENGAYEYREFCVPSPSTAMAEALVLANLGASPAFAKSTNIYSYLWPKNPECPFSFEHYVNGYKARNHDIALFLEANRDVALIVSDIEKFYPNISRNKAKIRFHKAMRNGQVDDGIQKTASMLLDHLFSGVDGDRGIATGPELSHVIGDLALSNVDEVLSKRYPGGYFRYVDDIVLAVPVGEAREAEKLLRDLASAEELTINPDKTEVMSSAEWLDHGPHHSNRVKENSFEALVFQIKVYLSRRPGGENRLGMLFRENGFNIPVERLASSGRTRSFVSRLKSFARRRWWVAIRALVANERDVLEYAHIVREEVIGSLNSLLEAGVPIGLTRRRWFVQHLRYLTNRAFYLVPTNDLRFLIEPLSQLPEFVETVALLKMLLDDNFEDILRMPGAALMAGAGMLKQLERQLPNITEIENNDSVFVDALSILLLFEVVSIDKTVINQFDQDAQELLRFADGQVPESRVRDDFSYIDELRCLQLLRTKQDNAAMVESRFSDQEEVVLDALDIGGEYDY